MQEEALAKHLGETLLTAVAFFSSTAKDSMNGAAHSTPPKASGKQADGKHGHADGKQPPKDEGPSKQELESAKARSLDVAVRQARHVRQGGDVRMQGLVACLSPCGLAS